MTNNKMDIEREIEKIEKLGYYFSMQAGQAGSQIIRLSDNVMIIDADFSDDTEQNAIEAINAFWNRKQKTSFTK